MPTMTPSVVADFIEASFPELRDRGTIGNLDEGSLQVVTTLVAMLDRLEEKMLASLTGAQVEYLRATANRWQYPRPPGRGPYTIGAFQPLGNRHPVAVVREVMRTVPEEPVAAVQRRLSFLNDPDLEQSIATDVGSAESAMSDGHYKNACVMAGAAIEALLLWAVQRRTAVDHQSAFARVQASRAATNRAAIQQIDADPRRWMLEQYIEIARELPVLSAAAADASMLAKGFRNLIHPGRAERLQERATRGSAAQALAAVALTTEDLAQRVAAGQL